MNNKINDIKDNLTLIDEQAKAMGLNASHYNTITYKQIGNLEEQIDDNDKEIATLISKFRSNLRPAKFEVEPLIQYQNAQHNIITDMFKNLKDLKNSVELTEHKIYNDIRTLRKSIINKEFNIDTLVTDVYSLQEHIIKSQAEILNFVTYITPELDKLPKAIKSQNDCIEKLKKLASQLEN